MSDKGLQQSVECLWPGRDDTREVYPERKSSKDPAPLKVKEVRVDKHRYILCLNVKQARKEALDRQVMVDALKQQTIIFAAVEDQFNIQHSNTEY